MSRLPSNEPRKEFDRLSESLCPNGTTVSTLADPHQTFNLSVYASEERIDVIHIIYTVLVD